MDPESLTNALLVNKYRIVSRILKKTGYDVKKSTPDSQEQASFYDIEEQIKITKKSNFVKFWFSRLGLVTK